MSENNLYDIQGYVVEVSQAKKYYRILGQIDKAYPNHVSSGNLKDQCFQINIIEDKTEKLNLGHQVHIKKAQLAHYDESEATLETIAQDNIVTLIQSYADIKESTEEAGIEKLKAYLSKSYLLPEWQGIQNIAHVQGAVVNITSVGNMLSFWMMNANQTPYSKESFMCFNIQMTREVYDYHKTVLKNIQVGDTLLVSGAVIYLDPAFKHADFTYDYDKQVRQKVMINIQANQIVKMPPANPEAVEKCIKAYLQDPFRLGIYGSRQTDTSKASLAYH